MRIILVFFIVLAVIGSVIGQANERYDPVTAKKARDEIRDLQRDYNKLKRDNKNDEAEAVQFQIKKKMEELQSVNNNQQQQQAQSAESVNMEQEELAKVTIESPVVSPPEDRAPPRAIPDEIQKRMDERMKYHRESHHERHMHHHHDHSRHSGRGRPDLVEKHEKHKNLAKSRLDDMHGRINQHINDAEEQNTLRKQVEEYYKLEMQAIAAREEIAASFEKARDIRDRDKRLAYLEKEKVKREARREPDRLVREKARETRQGVEDRLRAAARGSEL